jgi:hypothetical protein
MEAAAARRVLAAAEKQRVKPMPSNRLPGNPRAGWNWAVPSPDGSCKRPLPRFMQLRSARASARRATADTPGAAAALPSANCIPACAADVLRHAPPPPGPFLRTMFPAPLPHPVPFHPLCAPGAAPSWSRAWRRP